MEKNITLHIVEDYNALSKLGAEIFASAVNSNPQGNYGFATGGTPEGMYENLVAMSQAGTLDLKNITAFNLDEYVGLSQTSDQSYFYYMANKLFNPTNVPVENRNIPKGDAPCPVAEAARYEADIYAKGGIDFQILGIGTNGHIGFNEPDDHFAGPTSHVPLTQSTIDANTRYFADSSQVPRYAISMGIQTIMMAKTIMLLASGESKAKTIADALNGPITPQVPASALQLHQNVIVIADKAAAAFLS